METKVLASIMKLQAAQIMLSNEGIFNELTTSCKEHGSLELTAYTYDPSEAAAAIQILNTYTFEGAKFEEQNYAKGTTKEFTTYSLKAYISNIED